jgi:hypothetical protein
VSTVDSDGGDSDSVDSGQRERVTVRDRDIVDGGQRQSDGETGTVTEHSERAH